MLNHEAHCVITIFCQDEELTVDFVKQGSPALS